MNKQITKIIAAGLASLTMFFCTLTFAQETTPASETLILCIDEEEFELLTLEEFKELSKEEKLVHFNERSSAFNELESYLKDCNHPLYEKMNAFNKEMDNRLQQRVAKILIVEYLKFIGKETKDDFKLEDVVDLMLSLSEIENPSFEDFAEKFTEEHFSDSSDSVETMGVFIEEKELDEFYTIILECVNAIKND